MESLDEPQKWLDLVTWAYPWKLNPIHILQLHKYTQEEIALGSWTTSSLLQPAQNLSTQLVIVNIWNSNVGREPTRIAIATEREHIPIQLNERKREMSRKKPSRALVFPQPDFLSLDSKL